MKNYNVVIQVVKENVLSIPAFDKKEALFKAEELVNEIEMGILDVDGITNKYIKLNALGKNIIPNKVKIIHKDC